LSTFLAGFTVKAFGFNIAFLGLASIALLGMLFFAVLMPETKEYRQTPAASWGGFTGASLDHKLLTEDKILTGLPVSEPVRREELIEQRWT
jgi:hypothetical protein